MLGTLWAQMSSIPPKHQMTGLTLLPINKSGGVPFTKCTTQSDVVSSPTALYFHLDYKDSNTRLIVYHLDARQFCKIKTTLQYIYMEDGIFSTKGGGRGNTRMWWRITFLNRILLHGLMRKRRYLLEAGNYAWMRRYRSSQG